MIEVIKEPIKYITKCTNEKCACEFTYYYGDSNGGYIGDINRRTVECPYCKKSIIMDYKVY